MICWKIFTIDKIAQITLLLGGIKVSPLLRFSAGQKLQNWDPLSRRSAQVLRQVRLWLLHHFRISMWQLRNMSKILRRQLRNWFKGRRKYTKILKNQIELPQLENVFKKLQYSKLVTNQKPLLNSPKLKFRKEGQPQRLNHSKIVELSRLLKLNKRQQSGRARISSSSTSNRRNWTTVKLTHIRSMKRCLSTVTWLLKAWCQN